ncbi:hypothetical protein [Botrimarina sp.]|uniref:hypothetical protein n=1 Tax=Botrimarina sp. TaxID=2795802 RepID=UPI0032EAE2D0
MIRKLFACVLAASGAGLAPAPCAAQHADVLVFDNGGKLGVGLYDFESQSIAEQRVHRARFDDFYAVNNPGFTALAGAGALPGGADLGWDFLPMTVDSGAHTGYESTLLYWDGTGDPEFGPTPTDQYELSLFGRDGSAVADGGADVVPGGVIDRTASNGAIHEHRFFFLDDNGDGLNTTLPAAGVYLLGMRVRIDGLEASDPFYYVWATPEPAVLPAIQPAAAWVEARVDTLFVDGLPGDFNGDGLVDAADYTLWRDGLGDGFRPEQYGVWAANYGPAETPAAAAAPEPAALWGAACVLLAGIGRRGRRDSAVGPWGAPA